MVAIAETIGFEERTTLLTADANGRGRDGRALCRGFTGISSGDILFLTYSGHGASLPDKPGHEPDQRDETWVLYDRQFVDDEALLAPRHVQAGRSHPRALLDSCHSRSVAKELPSFLNPGALEARFGTSEPAKIAATGAVPNRLTCGAGWRRRTSSATTRSTVDTGQ